MVQHPLTSLLVPQQYPAALIAFALGIVVYLLPASLWFTLPRKMFTEPREEENQAICVLTTALNMEVLSSLYFITKIYSVLKMMVSTN